MNLPVLRLAVFLGLAAVLGPMARGATLGVRQSARSLSPQQRSQFVQCVLWMKRHPSAFDPGNASGLSAYDWLVKLHNEGFLTHLTGGSGVHMAPSFFPWHREFLRAFEGELQRAATDLGIAERVLIPYWDWTDPGAAAAVFREDFMGGNGGGPNSAYTNGLVATRSTPFRVGTGPFATRDDRTTDFPVVTSTNVSGNSPQGAPRVFLQRAIATHNVFGGPSPGGAPPPAYPDATQISYLPPSNHVTTAMAMTIFDLARWDYTVETNLDFLTRTSFRNFMEGHTGRFSVTSGDPFGDELHGRVHLWVGGNMSASSSPNDPVFWLHHANLDRLWAEWQDRHGIYNFPAEWFYLDTGGNAVAVAASAVLWGYGKSVSYPADVTSLDTLDIRASGIRYDTMPETAPPSLTATIALSANGAQVVIRTPSIKGLRYQLEACSALGSAWSAAGSPIIADGAEVQFAVVLPAGSRGEFYRVSVTAASRQPLALSAADRARFRALLDDPICGIPAGGWTSAGR